MCFTAAVTDDVWTPSKEERDFKRESPLSLTGGYKTPERKTKIPALLDKNFPRGEHCERRRRLR